MLPVLPPPAPDAPPGTVAVGPVVVNGDSRGAAWDRGRRVVAIINAGGTIGMKANAKGSLEPCPGYLAERVSTMPEFQRPEMPLLLLVELLPLVDSSDMGPADWIRIATTIEALYTACDGFVCVLGTDTMAYAASALSFLCENLGKTVILTGAMLPLVDVFSDAQRNLIVSTVLATVLDVPEVCVFINDRLLRGNRTVKVNSSGLDAFDSPNYPPLATLEVGVRFRPQLCLTLPRGRFRVHKTLATNIAVWRMIPGFDDEYIVSSIQHARSLRAIVLELYGTGNMSSRKASLIDALKTAIGRGIIIVASSQCMRGTVDLGMYALGRNLQDMGVVAGGDMTTEAIAVKLAYLLSWPGISNSQVAELMTRNLRGELLERVVGRAPGHMLADGNGEVLISPDFMSGLPRADPAAAAAGGAGDAVAVVPTAADCPRPRHVAVVPPPPPSTAARL